MEAMKKLKIQTGENNSILRTKSVEVRKFDTALKTFAKVMKATMAANKGLGLAAPQVGENIRMVLLTLNYDQDEEKVMVMVNPVITEFSGEMELGEEGCLSLPGIYEKVERHAGLTVEFFNVEGARQILSLSGLDAREVQHETDHLDGVLFIDRVKT
jgi:peptide deformylase